MDKSIKPATVRILDKEYMVACPEGEEASLKASARRVDQEMRKVRDSGKVFGTDRIAVMVALNLAYELLKCGQNETADPALIEQLQRLRQSMDSALGKYDQ